MPDKLTPEHLTKLLEYCDTECQAGYIKAVIQHDGMRAASRALGVHDSTIVKCIKRARRNAARQGYAPDYDMTREVPDGFYAKGVSTYYNKDGQPAGQWVKSSIDNERQWELRNEIIAAMAEEIRPTAPIERGDSATNENLLNLFVVTDYHLGSRSWPEETRGEAWDTTIAEDMLCKWFQFAIESSPNAETAILAQLGDFLDHDGQVPVTPTSGHVMDADSRFQKMVRIAIQVLRRVIAMLLVKHERVHVIMAEGNHDIASSVWLREAFYALYGNEPRVTVDRSPDPYYCYEHGKTSLFFHHGHLKQPKDIDSVFVAKFRDVFGRTKHSFAHLGHKHHIDIKETNLMVVEQHRTLCARNSHESRGGWISGRDAKVVTYHKDFGRVAEQVISPEML